jgi:multidrug efflux pump subunit AcrB
MYAIIRMALSRPITMIVFFVSLLIFAIMSLTKIPIDIFPKLNAPTIYVVEPYAGMSPQQMEGFFSTGLQDQFLYINGIKDIESKNIQGLTLMKLTFYEGADMAEAASEVAILVNRSQKFFPNGALPPLVVRYDASSLPVGELVFSSKTKSLNEIFELASTRIRPMFASVQGLSATPAMGGNARSVLIDIDPEKIRAYDVSPDEVVAAIAKGNVTTPSGLLRIGSTMYMTTLNSVEDQVSEFSKIPLKVQGDKNVFISDQLRAHQWPPLYLYTRSQDRRCLYLGCGKRAKSAAARDAEPAAQ